MKRKLTLAMTVLTLTFGAVSSQAMCSRDHDTAMSCAEGTVYDAAKGTCVPQVSS